jgi:hypothetical protein
VPDFGNRVAGREFFLDKTTQSNRHCLDVFQVFPWYVHVEE